MNANFCRSPSSRVVRAFTLNCWAIGYVPEALNGNRDVVPRIADFLANIAFRLQACNIHTPTDDDRFWGVLLTFNLPGNIALQSRAHFISNTSYHASHFNLLLMPTKGFRAKQSLLFAVCDVCIGT